METCAGLAPGERAVVVCEARTLPVAQEVAAWAERLGAQVALREIAPLSAHGQEPPDEASQAMASSRVCFMMTWMSLAHTQACRRALELGARCLSLPQYTAEVLAGEAMAVDFRTLTDEALRLAEAFSQGAQVRLTSPLGTDLRCDIRGRRGNPAPGWCYQAGVLASPPDAESNVALVEDGAEGVLVVDGSATHPRLGLLGSPLRLQFQAGKVCAVEGEGAGILQEIIAAVGHPQAPVAAELGVGLNPSAQLSGSMLEDEGCRGTAHVGLGANATLGGKSSPPFHLDLVARALTLEIDGSLVMEQGHFRWEANQ